MKKIIATIMTILGLAVVPLAWGGAPAYAEPTDGGNTSGECNGVKTSIIGGGCVEDDGEGGAIFDVLSLVLDILTFGVGIAATIGMVIAGYQYLTARDNVGQVQKAKMRIAQIVIGLAVYALMWGVLKFLLPGGVLGDGS